MYKNKPSFVYGFHAIDEHAAARILNQQDDFVQSDNDYDWLGNGTFFWENNLPRAVQYGVDDSSRSTSKIKTPAVLGAVIDLGNCLDLLDQEYLDFLKFSYEEFKVV